jgi:hypothetical protein
MALFVAAPTGNMNATGTGNIESQQHTAASHTAITHEFRASVPVGDALFSAITWADVNTEGNVDASSGQTDFTVVMDQAAFAAALQAVIESALGGKAQNTFSLSTNATALSSQATVVDPSNLNGAAKIAQTILDREVRLEVEAALNRNGVLEYLEGDSLGDFALALDASGGAADMASKLPSNSAALRNLFLQIPNRTSGGVAVTDESGTRLPVQAGDEIAFIFTVAPSVTITQVAETADAAGTAAGAAENDLTEASMPVDGIAILVTDPRKIAFIVQVTA